MTATERLEAYKDGWVRQLFDCGMNKDRAENAVRLAELNGLLDPLKTFYATMVAAEDPKNSDEVIGMRVRNDLLAELVVCVEAEKK